MGPDFRCDIQVPHVVETIACAALFRGGAINCRSERVNCPRYSGPSSRHGVARFKLQSRLWGFTWSFSYPRRFSLYRCAGQGFNTDYTEVGISNFDARAGDYGSTWPRRDRWPRNGVFLIVGVYESPVDITPQPDTRFPLSLEGFHRLSGFDSRPGIAREVWSHGGRAFVQVYVGPSATIRDRAALFAALHSLRL